MCSTYLQKERLRFYAGLLLFLTLFTGLTAQSQYFGRNKVNYREFHFKVAQSPNFELYHYLESKDRRDRLLQQSEAWYRMHQQVFKDTFDQRNPLIMYSTHAEFQQTRAIQGQIGVGTGGVTEGLKNRVVMPFMESHAQTDHVLGHELVHAFQYHLIKDTFNLNAIGNLPLWMVEGLAEYLSIGYVDAHTAIWLRSAVAHNKLPTLKDLTNKPGEYFPYRWGQAFWSYVTGTWGDTVIRPLFIESARVGYAQAVKNVLQMDEKAVSEKWKEAIRAAFSPYRQNTTLTPSGRQLVDKRNAGELNIVPSISPDGKRVAFWTEKNLFSVDLYVADAETGNIRERVTSTSLNSHIDEYSSFESSVTWSPDSRRLAFVAFAKGQNRLIIAGADNGKVLEQIDVPGVASISNPTWSPNGRTIVMTGLVDGQSDLYAYELDTRKVRRLTNDRYSDLQPSFSPDGSLVVFSTDRRSMTGNAMQHHFSFNLALLDLRTGAVTNLDFFSGANNLNPVFGTDNQTIYFLSDQDGFRNLYSYHSGTGALVRMTNLYTGITGITMYSPAISASRGTGRIVYSVYNKDEYNIYGADSNEFNGQPVPAGSLALQPATLPPFNRTGGADIVQNNLKGAGTGSMATAAATVKEMPYKPKFQLDYIGNTGVGVAAGRYGTGLSGGVNGIASDILGNNQLFGAVSLNGEIYDLGGQFAYINQKKRINWGFSASHIPYLSGYQSLSMDTVRLRNGDSLEVMNYGLNLIRTFEDQLSAFVSYPFSQVRRLEGGASFARYSYRMDKYSDYYDPATGFYVGQDRQKQPTPPGFNFGQAYVALVGDNSFSGVASPLAGHRFRFEASQYIGVVNLSSLTADYRKYFRMAPLTLATRNMFLGRYGRDEASGVLPPLFLGYPSLVRGYDALQFQQNSEEGNSRQSITINDLVGSKMYVGNVELRLPFTGPERLSAIKSKFLFTELNLFTDAGLAWGRTNIFGGDPKNSTTRNGKLVMSSGVSMRVNLFGYLVLEPYFAIPWQNGGTKNATFGLNFTPGF